MLTAAAAWTGLEVVRTHAFGGAPWDLLAHALYGQPRWIQIADLGGAFAVSFVVMAINTAVAEVTVRPWRAALQAGATAGILALLTLAYGAARLADVRDEGPPTLRLALVQGNVDNAWRVDAARADDAFRVFADLTRGVMGERPRLVVWPENAVSFLLEPNPRFGRAVASVLARGDAWLLLGGPRFAQTGDGSARFHNSAHLLASSGEQRQVYDKRHLVPFAEYAPLPSVPWLGWRFDAPGDYTPGESATVFEEPVPFGVLICFEVIYPELARDLVRSGAELLLNISNDAWFGNSAGLEQHFAMSVFRAVETRRALARAANTGVTGLIGPSGVVLARFPTGVPGAWVVTAPVRDDTSVYVRAGDTFAWGAGLVAVVVLLGRRRRRDP